MEPFFDYILVTIRVHVRGPFRAVARVPAGGRSFLWTAPREYPRKTGVEGGATDSMAFVGQIGKGQGIAGEGEMERKRGPRPRT